MDGAIHIHGFCSYIAIFFLLVCFAAWVVSLLMYRAASLQDYKLAWIAVSLGIAATLLINLMAVTPIFLIPQFAEFYKDFSGGQAQLPELTQKMLDISEELRYHWYYWIVPYLAINLAALSAIVFPILELGDNSTGEYPKSRTISLALLIIVPLLFCVNAIFVLSLYLPIFNVVDIIK